MTFFVYGRIFKKKIWQHGQISPCCRIFLDGSDKRVDEIQSSAGRDGFLLIETGLQVIGVIGKGVELRGALPQIIHVGIQVFAHIAAQDNIAVQKHVDDING